ncbi:MAG: PAS domain S-box protein [Chloroflexi bacterium]|nr:PAS domain S-box protein [Chloroflexota bacterium]MDA1004436.1 PAS domain S-box protein [Chloroflexota bacterium]
MTTSIAGSVIGSLLLFATLGLAGAVAHPLTRVLLRCYVRALSTLVWLGSPAQREVRDLFIGVFLDAYAIERERRGAISANVSALWLLRREISPFAVVRLARSTDRLIVSAERTARHASALASLRSAFRRRRLFRMTASVVVASTAYAIGQMLPLSALIVLGVIASLTVLMQSESVVSAYLAPEEPSAAQTPIEAQANALRVAHAELAVYRQMVARAADEMLILQNGRVVVRNGAFNDRLGYDLYGQALTSLVHPRDLAAAANAIRAIESGERDEARITLTLRGRLGQTIELEASLSPIELNGSTAVVAVARDISERRRSSAG